jgi:RHS repeat-associated protein
MTPDNAVVTTDYAGNAVTVTDQAGKKRKSVTDALGRLVQVYENPDGLNYLTSYSYDSLNNLTTVTQGTQQRFFMYDSLQRLIRSRNPEQDVRTPELDLTDATTGNSQWSVAYVYDNANNLTQKKDARLVAANYIYDALNRVTTVDYSDTTPDVRRFYDGATNGVGRFWYAVKGDEAGANNVEKTSVDSYDALGRPPEQQQSFKLNGTWKPYQTTRTYNMAGGVLTQTYPSIRSVSYSYDDAGRATSFSGNLGDGTSRTYSNNINYSPFGGLSREQYGTNTPLYQKSFYNIRGQLFDTRLSSVNDTWDWNRGRLLLYYSSNHVWGQSGTDNNGNVRFAENWIPPENATLDQPDTLWEDAYTYDALNRLISVAEQKTSVAGGWGTWTQQFRQQYAYDRYGNRTIDAVQTWGTGINNKQFVVDAATNRLGAPGQPGWMTYDKAGNLITDTYTGAGAREYDAENKMTRAWGGNNQWQEYTYNADGQRTRRKINGQETWQIYGMDGELLAEYAAGDSSSTPQKEYGYRNGQLLITASPGSGSNSLSLNGSTAYVEVPNSSSLNIAGPITMEAWIKLPSVPTSYQPILDHSPSLGNEGGYDMYVTDTGKARIDIFYGPSYQWLIGATTLSANVWHHLAGVYDGSQLRLYIDGQLDGSVNLSSPMTGTAVQLRIGRNNYLYSPIYFNGLIDEVRISTAALYSSNFTPAATLTASSNTKGLWKFDGQTTADSSGNGNNGTLQGATYSADVPSGGGSSSGTDPQVQWLLSDHLGTPRMIIDQSGTLANLKRHDYLPFGEELFAPVGGRTASLGYMAAGGGRQQFTQKERDVETGLDYFINRYYSSVQGRFLSVDPQNAEAASDLIDPQSWNGYAYVKNNPCTYTDPDGRCVCLWERLKNAPYWFRSNREVQELEDKWRNYLREKQQQYGTLIWNEPGKPPFIVDPNTLSRDQVFYYARRLRDAESDGTLRVYSAEDVQKIREAQGLAQPPPVPVLAPWRSVTPSRPLDKMGHAQKHLGEFQKIDPSLTKDDVAKILEYVRKVGTSTPTKFGGKAFEAAVDIGGKSVTVKVIAQEAL